MFVTVLDMVNKFQQKLISDSVQLDQLCNTKYVFATSDQGKRGIKIKYQIYYRNGTKHSSYPHQIRYIVFATHLKHKLAFKIPTNLC